MRVERVTDVAQIRALVPGADSVAEDVRAIVAAVRSEGDDALRRFGAELDGIQGEVIVSPAECEAALQALDPAVRSGLEVAVRNVKSVARGWLVDETQVELPEGHTVRLREIPVHRAAVYAPGGRNPYPSTVVMGAVAARVAGVREIVVCVPQAHPVMLAAAVLCGADQVLCTGGAHTVAALAYGTETIGRCDVIVGPGGPYVQEAKRQVSGDVGIDMFAGPSDLMILADGGVDDDAVIADLLAQAEHGEGSLAVLVTADKALLDAAEAAGAVFESDGVLALIETDDPLPFAEEFAPEHLQLIGPQPEAYAPVVTRAGCVFVGAGSGTAFGDYVAGSNHTLPTAGSARFASGLNPGHFRRRVSEVRIGPAAAARLSPAGVAIAEAEGFVQHAKSMSLRENGKR